MVKSVPLNIPIDLDHITSLLQKSLMKKADSVLEPIDGYVMQQEQKEHILTVKEHVQYIDSCIHKLDAIIDNFVESFESQISLLCSLPCVNHASTITIISEIGTDMSPVNNVKCICCCAALTPGNNKSAGKKRSVRITRAGVYLKPALFHVTHTAVKDLEQPYYKIKYERIMKRCEKKFAINAIARMILTAINFMYKNDEVFNPSDLYKFDMSIDLKDKQEDRTIKQATKPLLSKGITQLTSYPFLY